MLSVVIPALNEEKSIKMTIDQVRDALNKAEITHEIIVINDGSIDNTSKICKDSSVILIEHPARGGYGRSIKDGIRKSKYDLIAITDADGTYPVDQLPVLYDSIVKEGYDMAVGARKGKEYRGSLFKRPGRMIFTWLVCYATGEKIEDVNSGLRIFRREIPLNYWNTIANGFSFTTTITLAAFLNGYFVKYIPIDYYKRIGRSYVNYWRDSLRSLQIIVQNILYYNPFKMFLLLINTLLLVAFFSILTCLFGFCLN